MGIMSKQYEFLTPDQRRRVIREYEKRYCSISQQNTVIRKMAIKYGVKQTTLRKVIADHYAIIRAKDRIRMQRM